MDGSQLGKNLSANNFHEHWKTPHEEKPEGTTQLPIVSTSTREPLSEIEVHPLFNFVDSNYDNDPTLTGFSLLGDFIDRPQENYEELLFENAMKKRKRKRRR